MLHIVSSGPQTKLEGDLRRIYSADYIAVQWLMGCGSSMHRTIATFIVHPECVSTGDEVICGLSRSCETCEHVRWC